MSNSDVEDLSDSDYDPDKEYGNQWPQRNNGSKSNSSASEESENESDDEQEGGNTASKTFPNVLKKLTHSYILEIYGILDACRETNFRNALAINKEMQNKLIMIRTQIQSLHSKVVNRYSQNEELLIDNMSTKKGSSKTGIFGKRIKGRTFFIRGSTFFKDENIRISCPNNEDYTRRSQNGEIFPMDFDLVARHIWSISDKMAIVRGIKEQIITEKSLHVRVSNKNAQLITLLEKVGKDFQIDWMQISAHNLSYRHSPTSCKAMWDVYLQPALKHDSFSTAENERLMQAIEKHQFQNWSAIAKEVGKRSDYQCFLHYHTTMFCRGRWSRWDKKDDNRLLEAIEASKCNGIINWSQVAFQFPQKSKAALQQRYQYTINPAVSHAPFTAEEDLLLLAAVQEYGINFAKLPRSLFPNRSVVQLRTRYNNTLQNRHKLTAWSLEDDKLLMEFVKENGVSSWKKLEETFENRHTRISCRQRYHVIQRHLSKDSNATLEQIQRKKYCMSRSDVTTINWQQKVEELRANPTNSQGRKRQRKNATKFEKTNKHVKILIEIEDKESENTTAELAVSQLELNNEMETIIDTTTTTTTDSVTKNTALNTKSDMIKTVQNHICSISKVCESEKINPAVSHAPFTNEEDLLLLAAVQKYGINLAKLPSSLFPNRSVAQLRTRYNNTLENRHKLTAWTLEDDKLLMEFVKENGVSSWKKLEETFGNRHTRASCRQRYHVIQKHLSKDSNATLEQIKRKKYCMSRSDVTTINWQQKVEELRTNQIKTMAKKRKRKETTKVEKSKTNKHVKSLIEIEDNESENTTEELEVLQLELNNEMETIVDTTTTTTTTGSVTKNTALNAKSDMIKIVQDHIGSMSNETRVTVYYGIEGNKNKPPTKKPIYLERLRANGLRFHDFLKYSYNFRFGREPVSNFTYQMEGLEKAKECLGFQMPSLKELSIWSKESKPENLNGICVTMEFRQRLKNFIRNSVKSGTTLEPADSKVPPNFSTLATLRSLCVLSTDYAKRKEGLLKLEGKIDCDEVPISSKNTTAIERFRQRFRNLFYQAAILSRLPPSSLENRSLKNPSTYPTEFHRPLINNSKKVVNSIEILNVVKIENIADEAKLLPVIKTEIEFESDKETNQRNGFS